jgi:hypothetical protein
MFINDIKLDKQERQYIKWIRHETQTEPVLQEKQQRQRYIYKRFLNNVKKKIEGKGDNNIQGVILTHCTTPMTHPFSSLL